MTEVAENLETPEIEDVPRETSEDAPPELPPIEPLPQWAPDIQERFNGWADLEGGRDIQQFYLDQMKSHDQKHGDMGYRLKQLNDRWSPYESVLDRHRETLALSRMEPHTAIDHALTFLNKARQDPQWAIQQFVEQGNVDLAKMIEEQPYVDPATQAAQREAQAARRELREYREGLEREKRETFDNEVRKAARDFESAEENGKLKYPHVRSPGVLEAIAQAAMTDINQGKVPDYPQYYEQVIWAIPEVREQLFAERAKKTASEAAEEAQKAKKASATVKGSGDGVAQKKLGSVADSVKAAADKMDWPS